MCISTIPWAWFILTLLLYALVVTTLYWWVSPCKLSVLFTLSRHVCAWSSLTNISSIISLSIPLQHFSNLMLSSSLRPWLPTSIIVSLFTYGHRLSGFSFTLDAALSFWLRAIYYQFVYLAEYTDFCFLWHGTLLQIFYFHTYLPYPHLFLSLSHTFHCFSYFFFSRSNVWFINFALFLHGFVNFFVFPVNGSVLFSLFV